MPARVVLSVNEVTETQLKWLVDALRVSRSEVVRNAVDDLYKERLKVVAAEASVIGTHGPKPDLPQPALDSTRST